MVKWCRGLYASTSSQIGSATFLYELSEISYNYITELIWIFSFRNN